MVCNYNCITFECFKPGINCRKMFDAINEEFDLECLYKNGVSLTDWAKKIRENIELKFCHFFIALHNIDAQELRF